MDSKPRKDVCDSRVNHVKICHNIPHRERVKSLKRPECLLKRVRFCVEHVRMASGAEEQTHDISNVAILFKVFLVGKKEG